MHLQVIARFSADSLSIGRGQLLELDASESVDVDQTLDQFQYFWGCTHKGVRISLPDDTEPESNGVLALEANYLNASEVPYLFEVRVTKTGDLLEGIHCYDAPRSSSTSIAVMAADSTALPAVFIHWSPPETWWVKTDPNRQLKLFGGASTERMDHAPSDLVLRWSQVGVVERTCLRACVFV